MGDKSAKDKNKDQRQKAVKADAESTRKKAKQDEGRTDTLGVVKPKPGKR